MPSLAVFGLDFFVQILLVKPMLYFLFFYGKFMLTGYFPVTLDAIFIFAVNGAGFQSTNEVRLVLIES